MIGKEEGLGRGREFEVGMKKMSVVEKGTVINEEADQFVENATEVALKEKVLLEMVVSQ